MKSHHRAASSPREQTTDADCCIFDIFHRHLLCECWGDVSIRRGFDFGSLGSSGVICLIYNNRRTRHLFHQRYWVQLVGERIDLWEGPPHGGFRCRWEFGWRKDYTAWLIPVFRFIRGIELDSDTTFRWQWNAVFQICFFFVLRWATILNSWRTTSLVRVTFTNWKPFRVVPLLKWIHNHVGLDCLSSFSRSCFTGFISLDFKQSWTTPRFFLLFHTPSSFTL